MQKTQVASSSTEQYLSYLFNQATSHFKEAAVRVDNCYSNKCVTRKWLYQTEFMYLLDAYTRGPVYLKNKVLSNIHKLIHNAHNESPVSLHPDQFRSIRDKVVDYDLTAESTD